MLLEALTINMNDTPGKQDMSKFRWYAEPADKALEVLGRLEGQLRLSVLEGLRHSPPLLSATVAVLKGVLPDGLACQRMDSV